MNLAVGRVRGLVLQSVRIVAKHTGVDVAAAATRDLDWYAFDELVGLLDEATDNPSEFAWRAGYFVAKDSLSAVRASWHADPAQRILSATKRWVTCFDGGVSMLALSCEPRRTAFCLVGPAANDPRLVQFALGWLTAAIESVGVQIAAPFVAQSAAQRGADGIEIVGAWTLEVTSPSRRTRRDLPVP